ncbi:MAG: thrombospondin type 3 repeat-containing protein, partial [Nitrosopumilaceae archaeon]|nr:thrombospondin type 3 repeat-containing protein [Nitrosopumilaceae archaeon]
MLSVVMFLGAVAPAAAVPDSDHDGVPDSADLCPNLQEDYDPQYGSVIDGCPADFVPWYDVDGDGIQDHLDSCPTVQESYNRYMDEDGCPDTVPGGSAPA